MFGGNIENSDYDVFVIAHAGLMTGSTLPQYELKSVDWAVFTQTLLVSFW